MTGEEKNKLEQIRQLTNDMLVFVKDGSSKPVLDTNFEDFQNIEKNRQDLINDFFSHPVAEADSKEVAGVIQQVLHINEQIKSMLEKNKKQLAKEFKQFKTSKNVTSAYLDNSP